MPNTFTPEQIAQILEAFFDTVGARQYIGARYVPIFGRKGESSIEWDNTKPYEPLTIVLYQGNSFTSRQYVPEGADIVNTDFWAETGNFNAQVEQYRQEVRSFDGRITSNTQAIAAEAQARTQAVSAEAQTRNQEIESAIASEVQARNNAINTSYTNKAILIGDSYLRNYNTDEYDNPGWGDYFAQQTGFSIEKYKSGGAGWTVAGHNDTESGMNFLQMLDKAISEHTEYERNEIRYIVVQGIINDLISGSSAGAIQTNINTFINTARTKFPNAKLCISFGVCSDEQMRNTTLLSVMAYLKANPRYGVVYALNSYYWFKTLVGTYGRGDDIHPNSNGYLFLSRKIASSVMGNALIRSYPAYNASAIRNIIFQQFPELENFATVVGSIDYTDSVINVFLKVTLNDVTQIQDSYYNKRITLPLSTVKRGNLEFAPVYGVAGGHTYIRMAACIFEANDSNNQGNVTLNMLPRFTNQGTNVNYSNTNHFEYSFQIPIGI